MASSKVTAALSVGVLTSFLAAQAVAAVPAVASLASVDGSVMVNQGAGFSPVTDKTVLHAGDRILSLKGAQAKLLYANGCAVVLKPGSMITVASKVSCKAAGSSIVADTDTTGDALQVFSSIAAAYHAYPAATILGGTVFVAGATVGSLVAVGTIS